MSVLKIFSLIFNGQLPEGWTSDCLSHKLAFFDNLPPYNRSTLFGNTCAIDSIPGARKINGPQSNAFSVPRVFPNNGSATVGTSDVTPQPTVIDPVPSPLPSTSGGGRNRTIPSVGTWFWALSLAGAALVY